MVVFDFYLLFRGWGARLASGQGFFTMVVVVVIFRTELALLGDHMDQKSLVCFYMESSLPTGHREAQVPCDYSQG